MKIRAGETVHSVKNYAYKFDLPNGKSIAISGDGRLTDETKVLFRNADYLIHEGYFILGDGGQFHGSVESVLDYAIENGIPNVGIVHVDRAERQKFVDIQKMINRARKNSVNLFFPNDNDVIDLS
jgi:ribonuclease BN (tRNA processing enzyme)